MNTAKTAYLGLGTNLGDRLKWLEQALDLLKATKGIHISQISSIYETSPVDYFDQPDFYNLVCELKTVLTPMQLLHQAQRIEQQLKRVRKTRFGPRTIDIDVLLYDEHIIQQPKLIIPHPRMQHRAFVLVPLYELAPNLVLPKLRLPMTTLIEQLPTDQIIQRAAEQISELKGGSS